MRYLVKYSAAAISIIPILNISREISTSRIEAPIAKPMLNLYVLLRQLASLSSNPIHDLLYYKIPFSTIVSVSFPE